MYLVIIDGMSGSGKTTVAKRVADELDIAFFDSDLIIGAVALACVKKSVNPTVEESVKNLIQSSNIEIKTDNFGSLLVLYDGQSVAPHLKNILVVNNAYALSKLSVVNAYIKYLQKNIAKTQTLVIDGLNSAISFPEAKFKFFLSCDAETRAKRKHESLQSQGKYDVTYDEILDDIHESDRRSFTGEMSAVNISKDSIIIDTTYKSATEAALEIVKIVREKL